MKIIQKPVINFTAGRGGHKPIGVCIHIMEGWLTGTHSWFNNPKSSASSHYGISRNGEIWQFVREENTAWAQGIVRNPSAKIVLARPGVNPNKYLISIEHEGFHRDVWTEAMKKSSAWLIQDICGRYGIPIDRIHIIGHYEIDSVRRPNCPAVDKTIIEELIQRARTKRLSWLTQQLEILKLKLSRLLKGQ